MATKKQLEARKLAPVIGTTVTHELSGYTGVVRAVEIHDSGCVNALVQKAGLNTEEEPYKPMWLELNGMKDYKKLPKTERPEILGKKVRDTITEYEGTCVGVTLLDDYDARCQIQGTTRTEEGVPSPVHLCNLSSVERLDAVPVAKTKSTGAPAFLSRTTNSTAR